MKLFIAFYLLLAIGFFLPCVALPYKMCYPLALLSLASWLVRSPLVAVAMTFSLVGDIMGVVGQFPFQLTAFLICHVCLLIHFVRIKQLNKRQTAPLKRETPLTHHRSPITHRLSFITSIALFVVAVAVIVPAVPVLWLKVAVTAYAMMIIAMAYTATSTGIAWLAIGAWTFVASDTILAYNRFVCHLPHAMWLIMVPYFTAQLLIFCATRRT